MRTDNREMLAVGICGRSRIGNRVEALLRGRQFTAGASVPAIIVSAVTLGGLVIAGAFTPQWIAFAQSARPAFEVSAIKRSTSTSNNGGIRFTAGGLTAENAPLRFIIAFAYHIRDFQLLGAPGWTESERYEISAKSEGKTDPEEIRLMLQALLEDRFRLKIHRGTEQRTAFILSPAKGGIKVRESKADCAALANENSTRGRTCGSWFGSGDQFVGTKISMMQLGEWLSNQIEGPVVDRTGFNGTFDVQLRWSTDDQADAANTAPAIFTAVQEQMGIRIESGKGPVETLTIDHVERPDAN
jgi:uncharacterized protein (TIGR03435 family)